MTTRKRNEFLDLPSDEEDEQSGYDSEELENSRVARGSKRRKTAAEPEHEDLSEDDVEEAGDDAEAVYLDEDDDVASNDEDAIDAEATTTPRSSSTTKPSKPTVSASASASASASSSNSLSTLARRAASAKNKSLKTGVLYLSRIPPFLKPSALRSLLLPYAPHGLNRLFLTPEDPTSHRSRIKSGGNKKRTFTDGWVEFNSKRDAKIAAETLNTRIIGGKKGGWYHDDVWNVKYLKGFKWRHLTEQTNAENAERAARMRVEIRRTTRENKNFEANVERAKRAEGIEATRRRRGEDVGEGGKVENAGDEGVKGEKEEGRRKKEFAFRQNAVKKQGGGVTSNQSEEVKRVLSKSF